MLTLCRNDDALSRDLCFVSVKAGKVPSPFDKSAQAVPNSEGGFDIYFEEYFPEIFQSAARILAGLGLYRIRLESADFPFSKLDGYWFLTALYDGVHELAAALPLNQEELKDIKRTFEIVSDFRALADTDSKHTTPVGLVKKAFGLIEKSAEGRGRVKLRLKTPEDENFSEECAGLSAVGAGSSEMPCLGVIDYIPKGCSEEEKPVVALVGKGITFDSGGYDIKPPKFMDTMRTDKCGAVYMSGALALAIVEGLSVPVRLYLACSENMLSGKAMLPGDVLTYANGLKVEILNTDAEGRLVLADALIDASRCGASYILDAATLTGAAKNAVGRDMSVVFARDSMSGSVYEDFISVFKECREPVWRLPLFGYHRRYIKTRRADLANSQTVTSGPGASTAASFLEAFVSKEANWFHIDLSSAFLPDGSPIFAPGPTGATIVPVAHWLCSRRR